MHTVARVLGATTLMCYMLACNAGCWDPPGEQITEKDFASDAERRDFVQQFMVTPIPTTADGISFRYTQWLDCCLDASFSLPPADYGEFKRKALHTALSPQNPKRLGLFIQVPDYAGGEEKIEFDDKAYSVHIMWWTK